MEKGYFAAAWGDVTKSPGWVSTLIRLALVCLIPVFGVIVLYGYLYSWARDISWNVHRPLPKKIFGNEDGSLYKRGFFTLVVAVVFSLVPGLADSLLSLLAGASFFSAELFDGFTPPVVFGALMWLASGTVSAALAFLAILFFWVGSMRVSLYGTLSSGFQLGKIWAMMRYDFIGLLRILGMNVLIGVVILVGASTLGAFLVLLLSGFALLASFGVPVGALPDEVFAVAALVVGMIVFVVALMFASVLQSALTIRALGYWTRQFEVSQWRGQEDPMPFEQGFSAHVEQAAPTASVDTVNSTPVSASEPDAEDKGSAPKSV